MGEEKGREDSPAEAETRERSNRQREKETVETGEDRVRELCVPRALWSAPTIAAQVAPTTPPFTHFPHIISKATTCIHVLTHFSPIPTRPPVP